MKRGIRVEVTWDDASFDDSNEAQRRGPGLVRMHTLGYVVHDGRKVLEIAQERASKKFFRHLYSIPRGMIVDIKILGLP